MPSPSACAPSATHTPGGLLNGLSAADKAYESEKIRIAAHRRRSADLQAQLPGGISSAAKLVEDSEATFSKKQLHGEGAQMKRLMTRSNVLRDEADVRAMKEKMDQQSTQYRKQIRSKQRMTLDPHSKGVQRWDGVTTLALLFTATVTPFEVCVLTPVALRDMPSDPLSWVNRLCDCVFIVDIVLQCFLAFQEAPDKGGAWVYDNRRIFCRYLSSWMPLDVVTAVPVDVIIAAYEAAQPAAAAGSGAEAAEGAGVLRVVRMLRLVKLARILRASRIFRRWQAHLGISFAMIALVRFCVLTMVIAHWLACLWVLIGRLREAPPPPASSSSPEPSELAAPAAHIAFGTTWIARAGLDDASAGEIYGVALYVAFCNIFSGSGGNITPASALEYYVQSLMMLVGSSVWAYVISSGCGIIATLNPNLVHYRHMMDELNFFARDKRLPKEMTVKLREFFSATQHVHRQTRYDYLLDQMSARLKADAALCWAKETLMRVSYFKDGGVEDEFLASVALALKTKVFCRSEYIHVNDLVVLERGIAAKDGRISTKGSCLGEDMILSSLTFRDLDPAVALTFVVQVASLERKALDALLADFPAARAKIKHATFRLAFIRAIVQVAKAIAQARAGGAILSITDAFALVRSQKQGVVLREPTRQLLASNVAALAERTEALAHEGESSRQEMVVTLGKQVAQLEAKVDGQSSGTDGTARSDHGSLEA